MATNFPTTLDDSTTIPVESASTVLATNHVVAHQNIQDAIEAVEAKVGVNSSAVTTSHDYKLSEILTTDKSVGKSATQTLTNKTLTSPVITSPALTVGSDATGDLYYRSAGGFTRLPIGSATHILNVTGGIPAWRAETALVDASTTVKGVVEAGTAAEVTAGTATGATGAVLAVTPDALAASTPVFNGSGLTNVAGTIYTVNADEKLNTYYTVIAGMYPTSTTAVPGWTLASTTVTTTSAAGYIYIIPSASANFEMSTALMGSGSTNNYSPAQSKKIRIKTRMRFTDSSDRKGWGMCITPTHIHTVHTDLNNGEVRFIYNGSVMYAQNANGTATSTDVTGAYVFTNWNLFEIVFSPGTDIKYYINGTLVATHTTNLPTTGTLLMAYGVDANGRDVYTTHPTISYEL